MNWKEEGFDFMMDFMVALMTPFLLFCGYITVMVVALFIVGYLGHKGIVRDDDGGPDLSLSSYESLMSACVIWPIGIPCALFAYTLAFIVKSAIKYAKNTLYPKLDTILKRRK